MRAIGTATTTPLGPSRHIAFTLLATATLITAIAPRGALAADPWSFIKPGDDATKPAATDPAADSAEADADEPATPPGPQADSETPALPDPASIDWSLLNTDPSTWRAAPDRRLPHAAPGKTDAAASAWSRSDKPAGFSAVTVKQPVLPFWDARVGADLAVAGQSTLPQPLPEKIATDGRLWQSSGAAWAAMSAPGLGAVWDKTAIEARVDPSQEQSKLGTSISKSLPLAGNAYALTLQGGYNMIEQTMVPLVGANGRTQRSVEAENSAKLDITGTGTSLLAGQSLSGTEERWLRSIGAEQKLFDGLSVSGKVSETPTGNLNKSLSAGFRKTW